MGLAIGYCVIAALVLFALFVYENHTSFRVDEFDYLFFTTVAVFWPLSAVVAAIGSLIVGLNMLAEKVAKKIG